MKTLMMTLLVFLISCGKDNKKTTESSQLNPVSVDCQCVQTYSPVCATNGVTYSNSCLANCSGQTQYTPGTCGNIPGQGTPNCSMITQEYMPVCGQNGVTYGNPSMATCSGITSYTPGACPHQGTGTSTGNVIPHCQIDYASYAPVCGLKDGKYKSYNNYSWAVCSGAQVISMGRCSSAYY